MRAAVIFANMDYVRVAGVKKGWPFAGRHFSFDDEYLNVPPPPILRSFV